MTRNWVRTTATVTAVAAAALAGAVPASASPGPRHCVLDTQSRAQHCFATMRRALADTRGEIVQGTFFDGPDYTGNSLTITGPELCKKDGWMDWQFDLGDDWKNKITSVQPWGNCWIWLYPEPNLGGDRDGPFKENTGNIGSYMDNRAQSIGFS